jgi:putative transposase
MPNYRRYLVPGGTYFVTIATYQRTPIFADTENIDRLRRAVALTKREQPFDFPASVILPDHVHFIWILPRGDANYSKRVGRVKALFTRILNGPGLLPEDVTTSRRKHRESDVWNRRFWEHTIKDDADFEQHLHYVHYNPVKHGHVTCPHLWPYSSFRRWVDDGLYDWQWGCSCQGRTPTLPTMASLDGRTGE